MRVLHKTEQNFYKAITWKLVNIAKFNFRFASYEFSSKTNKDGIKSTATIVPGTLFEQKGRPLYYYMLLMLHDSPQTFLLFV